MVYKAHVNDAGEIQTVAEHSKNTAEIAKSYAVPELKDIVEAMGMIHDVGKYQESFQRRINGEAIRVEHSTCGAVAAKENYSGMSALMMEYCVAGHHGGLPDGGMPNDKANGLEVTLQGRMQRAFEDYSVYRQELALPKVDEAALQAILLRDCGKDKAQIIDKFAFLTRYCYSCLVDADTIDTAFFSNKERLDEYQWMRADFAACLEKVNQRLERFVCVTELQKTRSALQKQAFQGIQKEAEIYLMNMPTGSGKTLASIKCALELAVKEGKKRIIYVIPMNSIVDQTVEVLGQLFSNEAQILRHQSTFSYEDEEKNEDDERKKYGFLEESGEYKREAKNAIENWGAETIIVTTAVQFFETLSSNRRRKLRKLHNIGDSILVFDEAHLIPMDFLQPCMQGISYTTKYLNSKAILLTATMPDFETLVRRYALENSVIYDLIQETSMFPVFQKCRYHDIGKVSAEVLLRKADEAPSALIVVNKRSTARKLYQMCGGKKYHLSTYMAAVDREKRLEEIRTELKRLEADYPDPSTVPPERRIKIISTSLIEAGVDIDVHTAFRELTGLESVLQTGGRCNREGKRAYADVFVFELLIEKETIHGMDADITKGAFKKYEDISSPECIRDYFDQLFRNHRDELTKNTLSKICTKPTGIPFRSYAQNFKLIDSNTEPLVVAVDEKSRQLVETLRFSGGGMHAIRMLQKYTCTLYPEEMEELMKQHVIEDWGSGIRCLTNPDYYDSEIGITFEAKDYIL